ncbi:hsp70 nucleotide exchange factor fes1 [Pyricularia oryzae]|uniref:Hsp70 nucleotide exchange factor fes1 n=5 Tax=Pyricularia TaxID=48558 RepID=A0ABQ8NXG3_PYRGI|nr:hsp70-like protein [Pyricularia oryzae 70-15]ELQ39114.1 Hsp70 nucleotide exchange factor FES1 [Pyricularia oryzae Y34]KAH8846010.1 hsp70 nucleotide exchange factor fes1 [Pyricularia oryzae]KAI6303541.1 hsp70 nucleotide exchange factor fes1 [Pyricularia grisea]EHA47503.1 hsp70-like protein [Pyricularia oryzae 70-15]KAH9432486.1 hsp70 nucleotide exchange factor fes1 [Pyricularia oryzae]
MGDKNLNALLKWSIENTNTDGSAPAAGADQQQELQRPDPEVLAALFGGPSEAELMKAAMDVITSTEPDVTLDNKLIAFDNFEQLIESLDNANNLSKLSLWTPLLGLLDSDHPDLRRMAAWCIGTAVQNNEPCQERLLALGGLPSLVKLATAEDQREDVRRKAVYALSSAGRNYQPAMDVIVEEVGKQGGKSDKVDATNMDAVDAVIDLLKAGIPKKS